MSLFESGLCDWSGQVERFLLGRLGDPDLAHDLAQEAAFRLLRALQAGRSIGDPRAWLFRTARNLAIDEVRRQLPNPLGVEALGRVVDPLSLPRQEPCWRLDRQEVTRSELLDLLPDALSRLPTHYQRLLLAHYRDGMGCDAVADQERISVDNAKVRLFRARRRLRELLAVAVRRRFNRVNRSEGEDHDVDSDDAQRAAGLAGGGAGPR